MHTLMNVGTLITKLLTLLLTLIIAACGGTNDISNNSSSPIDSSLASSVDSSSSSIHSSSISSSSNVSSSNTSSEPSGSGMRSISSLEEFIALQDMSNQKIKMQSGTYHISTETKLIFPGNDWRANIMRELSSSQNIVWPAIFNFTGSNNYFDLTGVTFTFDSSIINELPNLGGGQLIRLGGHGNKWIGFHFEEVANELGEYTSFVSISGGVILAVTGSNHEFSDLTIKPRYSRPYGFGALQGKTGSSQGMLPGTRLGKKSGLFLYELTNTRFENIYIDHSSFGHALFFRGPVDNLVFDTVTVVGETRSTDSLRRSGIAAADRNGVPFGLRYNNLDLIGPLNNNDFFNLFDSENLDQCQNMDSGTQRGPIRAGYQFTLTENSFRGYAQELVGKIEIYNAHVIGTRGGIVAQGNAEGMIVENMTVRSAAGHGVPACPEAWNSLNGGEADVGAFNPPSYSVLKNVAADAAYATLIELDGTSTNITADIELLDPEISYHRPPESNALALISGTQHDIRIWKQDNQPLEKNLIIKIGHFATNNMLLCNLTHQSISLSNNVSNSTIYSIGDVEDNSNSMANNNITYIEDPTQEPDQCKLIATGFSRSRSLLPDREINWGDKVFISSTSNSSYSSDCGWYGCRVAFMDGEQQLKLSHGKNNPSSFYLRPDINFSPEKTCVEWHDKVVIAVTPETYNTTNCGYYGCRVARLNESNTGLEFWHGLDNPDAFYIRPPAGESKTGCIKSTDKLVLAITPDNENTENCGWYGCQVLQFDNTDLIIANGSSNPNGIYFRSWEQAFANWPGHKAPHLIPQKSWSFIDNKIRFSTGACLNYFGNGAFALKSCEHVAGNWRLHHDQQIRWHSNPWSLNGGACMAYSDSAGIYFEGCDDMNTDNKILLSSELNQLQNPANTKGLPGGACFTYTSGGDFGFIDCNQF